MVSALVPQIYSPASLSNSTYYAYHRRWLFPLLHWQDWCSLPASKYLFWDLVYATYVNMRSRYRCINVHSIILSSQARKAAIPGAEVWHAFVLFFLISTSKVLRGAMEPAQSWLHDVSGNEANNI